MIRTEIYDPHSRKIHKIRWHIRGFDNYGFADNKRLYNLTTGFEVKKVLKGGYSQGYNLRGKFYSLKKIKPLIIKI